MLANNEKFATEIRPKWNSIFHKSIMALKRLYFFQVGIYKHNHGDITIRRGHVSTKLKTTSAVTPAFRLSSVHINDCVSWLRRGWLHSGVFISAPFACKGKKNSFSITSPSYSRYFNTRRMERNLERGIVTGAYGNHWGLAIFMTDRNSRRLQECEYFYIDETSKTSP